MIVKTVLELHTVIIPLTLARLALKTARLAILTQLTKSNNARHVILDT
jgi:hypothetical protein